MTQELYQKAIKFAGEKHSNQKVPGTNSNYVLHISNVAMEVLFAYNFENNFDVDFAVQVALLHDTIEDTGLVKLADRITNLQTPPSHWSKEKIMDYCEEAKLISNTLRNKNAYLNKRLDLKITDYEQKLMLDQ